MDLTRVCSNPLQPEIVKSADFTFYRRTTFRANFSFKDNIGDPLPLTGYTVNLYIVRTDGSPILSLNSNIVNSLGSTILILDSLLGKTQVLITDEETELLVDSEAKWWITISPPNGDELLRGRGNIFIKEPYE